MNNNSNSSCKIIFTKRILYFKHSDARSNKSGMLTNAIERKCSFAKKSFTPFVNELGCNTPKQTTNTSDAHPITQSQNHGMVSAGRTDTAFFGDITPLDILSTDLSDSRDMHAALNAFVIENGLLDNVRYLAENACGTRFELVDSHLEEDIHRFRVGCSVCEQVTCVRYCTTRHKPITCDLNSRTDPTDNIPSLPEHCS